MFERNPVDNRSEILVAIEVTMVDGTVSAGRTPIAVSKAVHKLLEGEDAFIYLDTFDGGGQFVPKSDIRGVKVIPTGRPGAAKLSVPDARTFDPYVVLGLEKGARFDEIRDAYHALSKQYHPDRYAGVDLPAEVKGYLDAMARRVNAAFQALKYVGQKSQPIYSRGG